MSLREDRLILGLRTTFVQLAHEQFREGIGIFTVLSVMLHNLPEFVQSSVKWCEVGLFIQRGLVHVVKNLLQMRLIM